MTATAIIGAQWGSEGKGVVAAAMAGRFDVAVRVGGPNAGHSFYHEGTLHKMRGVPCAWVNPECELVIGAGAVVDLELLATELDRLPGVYVTVDERAVVVGPVESLKEEMAGLGEAIGSTQEGVGVARQAKIARTGRPLVKHGLPLHPRIIVHEDTSELIFNALVDRQEVMLEGTQGSGLSLHHGQWPYVTSADTNVGQLLADTGVPPTFLAHTYLVARTFPIRVGGNSGPMGKETTWTALPVDEPERTTVTNKVRRVSEWDDAVFDRAMRLNGPCGVFLMFTDYLAPELRGTTDEAVLLRHPAIAAMVARIEGRWSVPIIGLGTGGDGFQLASTARCMHGAPWR